MSLESFPVHQVTRLGHASTKDWTTARDDPGSSIQMNAQSGVGTGMYGEIVLVRNGIWFDTRALSPATVIHNAAIYWNKSHQAWWNGGCYSVADWYHVVTAPDMIGAKEDYGYLKGCNIVVGSSYIERIPAEWVHMDLSADGIAEIVPGGYTKFGLRWDRDWLNIEPARRSRVGTAIHRAGYSALLQINYTSWETYAPKLIIDFSAPVAIAAPKLIVEHAAGAVAAPKLIIDHTELTPVPPKLIVNVDAPIAAEPPKLIVESIVPVTPTPPRLIIDHTDPLPTEPITAGIQILVNEAWQEIGSDVMQMSIKRGRMHELDRVEAGTAVIVLNNESGHYWRYNEASTYYGEIKPLTRIRVVKEFADSLYSLFNGSIEGWQPAWQGDIARGTPIVVVEAADMFLRFSRSFIRGTYQSQLPGARINAVLTEIGWPAGVDWRDIDTGTVEISALDGSATAVNALEHLLDVAEADGGIFFMDGHGRAVFHDAQARLTGDYSTIRAILTKDDFLPPKLVDDASMIYTAAQINDEYYEASDVETLYQGQRVGQREYVRKLPILNPNDSAARAFEIAERYKTSMLRIPSLPIVPAENPARLTAMVLGYDLSTKIQVKLDDPEFPANLEQTYHIEGIQHDWNPRSDLWKTHWQLWDISKFRTAPVTNFDWVFAQAATYASAHAHPGTEAWNNHNFAFIGQYILMGYPEPYRIGRGLIELDTSLISGTAIEATLFVCAMPYSAETYHRAWRIRALDPGSLQCPLGVSDYSVLRSCVTEWGQSAALATMAANQWIPIPLNQTGIDSLNLGGITRIALRSNYDVAQDDGGMSGLDSEHVEVHGVKATENPAYSYAPPYLIVKLS